MADATVKLNLGQVIDAMASLGQRVPETMAVATRVSIEALIRDVVRNRMNDRARYIGVVTGTARRSVMGSGTVRIEGDRVLGSFGSSLIYVRAHELGFHGRVSVRGHTRRLPSSARQRRASKKPPSTGYVSAHTRLMNIRAKHFFADTMKEGAPGVERRLVNALVYLAKTGKVPSPGQVGA